MSSLVSLNLTALSPAIASTLPSLEHLQSSDYFQQMLLTDSALEALSISKSELELKLRARSVGGWRPSSAEAAAEYDAIVQSIADLEEVVMTFEDLQAEARDMFELRARSLRQRETSIMDLPTEVLLSIFKNFRPPLDFSTIPLHGRDDEPNVETVKSIRLTCLRFRQISSHLLVGRLSVSPDMVSLDRLERVSGHPEISRGERILSVDLRCYIASIAGDIHAFTALCFKHLEKSIENLTSNIKWRSEIECGSDTESSGSSDESLPQRSRRGEDDEGQERESSLLVKGVSLQSARNGVQQLRRILSMWEPFKLGTAASIEDSTHLDGAVLAPQRGHERYRELYQQQQRLIQDGSFARAVAANATASKSKVWLCMSDEYTERVPSRADLKELARSNFLSFEDPRCFDHALSYMVRPRSWDHLEPYMAPNRFSGNAEADLRSELPQSLLCEVPVAIHVAGAKLARLDVSVTFPPEKLDLSMSDEQLSRFTEATEDLEALKVATDSFEGGYTRPNLKRSQDLYAYLRAAMGRQIVPNLLLDLYPRELDSDFHEVGVSIEPLLRSSNWRGLKSAELGNLNVGLEGLRELVDMLEPGTRLRLWRIHLKSGTWAAALDCIRSKASQDSWLSELSGAECDLMPEEKYDQIFETFTVEDFAINGSKATQYIRSVEGVENPLLNWDDEAAESNFGFQYGYDGVASTSI